MEDAEKLHFSRIFHCLVSRQKRRLPVAVIASHLSEVGCGKKSRLVALVKRRFGQKRGFALQPPLAIRFSEKSEFFRTLISYL